jgi:peptidoglycan hydrolase-like protein with peptidoglycan-binding domain
MKNASESIFISKSNNKTGTNKMQTSNQQQLPACDSMPVLRRNDNHQTASDSVKLLQRTLQKYGFSSLKADGLFGQKTFDAVIEFQQRGKDHDSTVVVDGIVGPKTWNALGLCVYVNC